MQGHSHGRARPPAPRTTPPSAGADHAPQRCARTIIEVVPAPSRTHQRHTQRITRRLAIAGGCRHHQLDECQAGRRNLLTETAQINGDQFEADNVTFETGWPAVDRTPYGPIADLQARAFGDRHALCRLRPSILRIFHRRRSGLHLRQCCRCLRRHQRDPQRRIRSRYLARADDRLRDRHCASRMTPSRRSGVAGRFLPRPSVA